MPARMPQHPKESLALVDRALGLLQREYAEEDDVFRVFHEIAAYLPVPLVVYSRPGDDRIIWANRCMLRLFFGVAEESLKVPTNKCLGRRVVDVFPDELAKYVLEQNRIVYVKGESQMEEWRADPWVGIQWDCIRFPVNGEKVGVLLLPQSQEWLRKCQIATTS